MSTTAQSTQLVAGIRSRDPAALSDAYRLYGDRLYSFAMRLTGRRDAADELFQHAWLRLAEFAPRLQVDTNLLPWLLTVARSHWRSEFRKASTHARHETALTQAVAGPPAPDADFEARAELVRLDTALRELAEHHREILVLMIEADDVPQRELAAVLGLSEPAFRKRLSRARTALSAMLIS